MMMKKFNIKNALMLAAGSLLLSGLIGACTSYDYDEEMNNRYKEEARLKAEDEKIKAEIIASIQALHTELKQNIKTMEQTIDNKLSKKDKEVAGRFAAAENELKSLIETRAQEAGVKIEELGTTLTNAINEKQALFGQALSLARQELEKAIKDGDEANIKKAQNAIELIAKTEQKVKDAGQDYEERITRLLALETRLADMLTEIEKTEAEKARLLKQSQDFEDKMKALIDSKIQTFRSSDLARIRQTLDDYIAKLSYYNTLSDYTTELESLSSDVTNLTDNVQEAINRANDLVSAMNDAATALENFDDVYNEMETLHEEAEGIFEEAKGKIEENMNVVESDLAKMEEIKNKAESIVEEVSNLNSYMADCVSEAEGLAGSVDV